MADKDTSTNEDAMDTSVDDVETPDTQDEDEIDNQDNQNISEDDTESDEDAEDSTDDEDESDDDDSEDDEYETSEFKKAFSQIKGDSPEEYIPNLEEAYRKSSREGKRLAQKVRENQERLDAIAAAVAKNPELAKLLEEADDSAVPPTVDPALAKVRQDYEEEVARDLETFMGEHPDLDGDDELVDEFMENVAIVGAAARKKGRIIKPMEAYKRAWAMLGRDDSKNKLVDAAKSTASKPKTAPAAKKQPQKKSLLTPEQIAVGKKLGLSEKQLLESLKK